MSASQPAYFHLQEFSDLGTLLVGGRLYTYEQGTTTFKAAFADPAGEVPQTYTADGLGGQYIALNARGELPTPLYLSTGAYDLALKRADGSTVWTRRAEPTVGGAPSGASMVGADDTVGGALFTTVAGFISKLFSSAGSSLLGFIQAGIGAAKLTVQDVLRERVSITHFGAKGDGATDNTAALEKVAAYMRTFLPTARMPKVVVPAGTYCYATSPNWGIQGMTMEAQGGAVFKHTGAGNAFICDGGADGAGVSRIQVRGNLRVVGNANSVNAIFIRAVHHSFFEMSGRDVPQAILATYFTVCNEYRVKCTPTFEPYYSVQPTVGILAGSRGAGEQTAACTYYNPIMEGINGYGIILASAGQCTIIGGTSEGNVGGISVSVDSTWNNIIGLDMEANTGLDINCLGSKNTFENCLAMTEAVINASRCRVIGGTYNALTIQGPRNLVADVDFGNMGGVFTDNGVNTIRRNLYNITAASPVADGSPTPLKLLTIDGPAGGTTIMGSDDQIGGGSAADFSIYHYGAGTVKLWGNSTPRISYNTTGVAFNGNVPIAKPVVNAAATDLATALTLTNQIRAALLAYGLVS